jgi:hypothetical protein
VGDCPECGLVKPGAVDFCPNPQCRTYLGWASAMGPGTISRAGAGNRHPTDSARNPPHRTAHWQCRRARHLSPQSARRRSVAFG